MATVAGSRTAGMAARAWNGSLQSSLRPTSVSQPSQSCITATKFRRTLFQATSPRMKRPPKSKAPATGAEPASSSPQLGKDKPRVPLNRAPVLPYRPSPFAESEQSKQKDQQGQQGEQQQQQGPKDGKKAKPESLDRLFSQRKLPLVGAALAAGVLGFYITPLLITYLSGGCREEDIRPEEIAPDAVPTGLPRVGVAAFDASLDVPERLMGYLNQRKKIARASTGSVLEVAVGTGRNVNYYYWDPLEFIPDYVMRSKVVTAELLNKERDPSKVTSFTGVDLSGEALNIARKQLRVRVPAIDEKISSKAPAIDDTAPVGSEVVNVMDGRVRLFRADAMKPLPLPADGKSKSKHYDTVVQTFGLCSVADPVQLIANMAAVVKPETGRILLLEHGRGGWSFVNSLMDRYATRHFARFGCWWNRDMNAIVAKAQEAVPGLEVVSITKPGWLQFGTLWKIELRMRDAAAKK